MEDDRRSKTEALARFSKPSVESSLIDELSELLSDGSVTSRIPVEVRRRLSSIVGHIRSTGSVSVQHAQAGLMALFSDAQHALSSINEDSTVYDCIRAALMVAEIADYGSVSIIKGESWRFVSAVGHHRQPCGQGCLWMIGFG